MRKLFLLFGITAYLITSCSDNETYFQKEQEKLKSNLVFYTNAQAILNCGPFEVDVFIDNVPVGSISYPYINEELPDCFQSDNTLLIEKDTGTYNYFAKATCNNYIQWSGIIHANPDSCSKVFFDMENTDTGHILIYTNAQDLLDAREFDVNVYINDSLAGKLPWAFLPQHGNPSCDMTDTLSVLNLQKPVGEYSYRADFHYTTDMHYEPLGWSGNFEIKKDSCIVVYLSLIPSGSNLPESRLTGTWAEKYPELWDGISDTIVFTDNFKVEKHIYFDGWNYNKMNDSTILFQNDNPTLRRHYGFFNFEFLNDKEIVIYNFLDRKITSVVKNIHFIKIE